MSEKIVSPSVGFHSFSLVSLTLMLPTLGNLNSLTLPVKKIWKGKEALRIYLMQ
jgi:hypothetical protein